MLHSSSRIGTGLVIAVTSRHAWRSRSRLKQPVGSNANTAVCVAMCRRLSTPMHRAGRVSPVHKSELVCRQPIWRTMSVEKEGVSLQSLPFRPLSQPFRGHSCIAFHTAMVIVRLELRSVFGIGIRYIGRRCNDKLSGSRTSHPQTLRAPETRIFLELAITRCRARKICTCRSQQSRRTLRRSVTLLLLPLCN